MASHRLPAVADDPDVQSRRETVPFEKQLCSQGLWQTRCTRYHPTGPRDGPRHSIGKRQIPGNSRLPRYQPAEDAANHPDGQDQEPKPDR
jgi:hypothetical protein